MVIYILVFILSLIVLARSSEFLVRSLTGLSRILRFSEYAVAFIFMSMATSIPEFFVGISSAVNKIPEFSLGNVLGANLINITLVLSVVILLGKGLRVESKISRRNFWIISGFSFLPLLMATDGVISRGDGLVLLIAFGLYLVRLAKEKEYFTKTINNFHRQGVHFNLKVFRHLLFFFLGIGLLILSSLVIVWAGTNLSAKINISVLSFGILFVALGTALPELVFGIRARLLRHGSMAIGNSLGSVAFNSTLIIGGVSLIQPIRVAFTYNLVTVIVFLALAFFFFNFFVFSKSFISRKEGLVLFFTYILFLVVEYIGHFVL